MFGVPIPAEYGFPIADFHHPAVNTAASSASFARSTAAIANRMFVLDWIAYSYDATPDDADLLSVTFGSTTPWSLSPFIVGPQFVSFPGGLHNNVVNEQMVVQLTSLAVAATAKLNVGYRIVPYPPDEHAARTFQTLAGTNLERTVTLSAAENVRNVLDWVHVSWAGAGAIAAGTRFFVDVGGTTVLDQDVVDKRPYFFNDLGIVGAENEAIIATIQAGGANVAGRISTGSR